MRCPLTQAWRAGADADYTDCVVVFSAAAAAEPRPMRLLLAWVLIVSSVGRLVGCCGNAGDGRAGAGWTPTAVRAAS